MAIHEARDEDHVRRIDHLRAGGREVRSDRGDRLAFDQHVTGREISDLRIERDDRAAPEQQALPRIERGRCGEAFDALCGIRGAAEREPCRYG